MTLCGTGWDGLSICKITSTRLDFVIEQTGGAGRGRGGGVESCVVDADAATQVGGTSNMMRLVSLPRFASRVALVSMVLMCDEDIAGNITVRAMPKTEDVNLA